MGKTIKEMSDEELKSEYEDIHDLIYNIDCYGVSNIRYLGLLFDELHRRGFEITETTKVKFNKSKE